MLRHLLASQPTLVLLAGDFTYADSWQSATEHVTDELSGEYSCE
jgi:hypothetical protein